MATIFQNDQENQQNSNQAGEQSVPVTMQGSTPSNVPVQGTPATASPFSQNKANTNPASNLKKYREANQTDVSGKLASGASRDVETASSRFKNIRDIFDKGQKNIQDRLQQGQRFAGQISTGQFEGIAQDQNQLQAFGRVRDADVSDIDALSGQLQQGQQEIQPLFQQAQKTAQDFGTEEGRFGLLKRTFGQNAPSYNIGQQRLDQLLVQGDPNLRTLETQLKSDVGTLQGDITGLESEADKFIPQARTQARDLSTDIVSGLKSGEQQLQDNLNARLTSLQESDPKFKQELEQRYRNKQLTMDDVKFLGLDPTQGNTRLANWEDAARVIQMTTPRTLENTASAEDIAKYSAIRQLAGNQLSSEFDLALPEQANQLQNPYSITDRSGLTITDPFVYRGPEAQTFDYKPGKIINLGLDNHTREISRVLYNTLNNDFFNRQLAENQLNLNNVTIDDLRRLQAYADDPNKAVTLGGRNVFFADTLLPEANKWVVDPKTRQRIYYQQDEQKANRDAYRQYYQNLINQFDTDVNSRLLSNMMAQSERQNLTPVANNTFGVS